MASRRKGRILAFQALYSWDVHCSLGTIISGAVPDAALDAAAPALLDFSWAQPAASNEELKAFSRLLVTGTIENIKAIDSMIQKHLINWEIERLNRVDLAVLRMSVYTLMFQSDMPASIVIDEAIGISKEYGADDSFRFINGVLDNIRKTLETAGQ